MSTHYENPIIPGFHPDPSICRVGSDYYLVNSTFEYFPGVPIFHSRDLINWKQIGNCLTRESQLFLHGTKCSDGVYAPTIRHHKGVFYMATTNAIPGQGFRNFFVTATDPAGEWSEPFFVDQGGIDPSLCFSTDGKVYWTGNGTLWAKTRGIYQSEIDPKTGKRLTDVQFIWPGTGGSYPESPHLFQRGDYYYLSVAEGGTAECHMVTVARSKHPFGPFESCPTNPVLTHRSLMNTVQATGHADFFEDETGKWWVVFLGIRYADFGFHNLGRETFLAPVTWTETGWPVVNNNQKVAIQMEVDRPPLPTHYWPAEPETDHFTAPKLHPSWLFLRNPSPEAWSITERPSFLTLTCTKPTLDELSNPAFLGRRQQHFDCEVVAEVEFTPVSENEEAGLTVLMDNLHHAEIVVTVREGKRVVFLRRRIGSMSQIGAVHELAAATTLKLTIRSDRTFYKFYAAEPGAKEQFLGQHEVRYVSTQIAGGYTGVILGMFATGNGIASNTKACFDSCTYKAL